MEISEFANRKYADIVQISPITRRSFFSGDGVYGVYMAHQAQRDVPIRYETAESPYAGAGGGWLGWGVTRACLHRASTARPRVPT